MSESARSIKRREEFWMDDFKELYKNGNYFRFFPKYRSSRIEQLNAITRFCIYLILLILMFKRNEQWLYLPVTLIVMVVIFYNINKNDDSWKKKELDKILSIRKKDREDMKQETERQLKHDGEEEYDLDSGEDYEQNYDLEAGYIDSDGNIIAGEKTEPPKYDPDPDGSLFTVDEIQEFKANTCRKPTKENPFMNPSILDYNTEDPPAACNVDDDYINDSMNVNFNHDLFRNVDDLWERENSQRQFYTVPNSTIPNNQTDFAKWLYKVDKTCKEDQVKCLRYEDLRTGRYDNYLSY